MASKQQLEMRSSFTIEPDARKPVIWVWDKVIFKPAFSATAATETI